jgi:hypothetical protein
MGPNGNGRAEDGEGNQRSQQGILYCAHAIFVAAQSAYQFTHGLSWSPLIKEARIGLGQAVVTLTGNEMTRIASA